MTATAEGFVAFLRAHLGLPYEVDSCRFLNCPAPNLHADCSGFVYAGLKSQGVPFPTCTSLDWQWCHDHGSFVDLAVARSTIGGIAIRGGPNGYGPLGHIVAFVGDGLHTLEAASHTVGIIEGTMNNARGVGYQGALVPGLPWGPSNPTHPPVKPVTALTAVAQFVNACKLLTLKLGYGIGNPSPAVKLLQSMLTHNGVTVLADGEFGKKTEAAVRGFQGMHMLVVDGVVGPKTWAALIP